MLTRIERRGSRVGFVWASEQILRRSRWAGSERVSRWMATRSDSIRRLSRIKLSSLAIVGLVVFVVGRGWSKTTNQMILQNMILSRWRSWNWRRYGLTKSQKTHTVKLLFSVALTRVTWHRRLTRAYRRAAQLGLEVEATPIANSQYIWRSKTRLKLNKLSKLSKWLLKREVYVWRADNGAWRAVWVECSTGEYTGHHGGWRLERN